MPRRSAPLSKQVHPTALVYCEGAHDSTFMRHIKKLYFAGSISKTNFKVMTGGGGSPDSLVRELHKIPDLYDRYFVKVDNDRPSEERKLAITIASDSGKGITFGWTNPSLEALLLSILNPAQTFSRRQSHALKQQFERDYIPADKRTSPTAYDRVFPKALLDEARQRISELDDMIKFFES